MRSAALLPLLLLVVGAFVGTVHSVANGDKGFVVRNSFGGSWNGYVEPTDANVIAWTGIEYV